ncbi:MAG: PIG-L deacetylase family protein [Gammaproteobacteria bacterium]
MLNPEHFLIPFETSKLPPGPWLVFAPHADDETYGMGGSLLRASKEGIETHVVVFTDGALGGSREDLVEVRQKEVRKAAELLRLKSLQCWTEPDRGLEQSEGVVDRVVNVIEELAPAAVFFPAPLEIHPDHRAAAFIVWEALQSLNTKGVKPQCIAYEIGVQNPVNFFIDITSEKSEKEKVMAVYASQNSENNYPELVLSLDKGRTFSLPAEVEYAEGFYRFSDEDLQLTLREVTHKIIDLYQ